jgi:hypothetical protein
MRSLFLNCVLFTLSTQEVKDNAYILIFYTWLSKLIQNAGLTKDDFVMISIDKRTFDYIKTTPKCLNYLFHKMPCPHTFMIFPSPETMMEGMLMRYKQHSYQQDAYMYCDIDVIIRKPLRTFLERTIPDKMYVVMEGDLRDKNYGADMECIEFTSDKNPGYTSGIWLFTGQEVYGAFLNLLHSHYKMDAKYYALDQPFFNRAAYDLPQRNIIRDVLTEHTSFNGHNYNRDTCVLLNCAGDVGDGAKHYEKIQEVLIMMDAGVL